MRDMILVSESEVLELMELAYDLGTNNYDGTSFSEPMKKLVELFNEYKQAHIEGTIKINPIPEQKL